MLSYGSTVTAPVEEVKVEETIKENEQSNTTARPGVILSAIAKCESGNRQFNADGTVLRGVANPQDVGMFQINERYHLADSKRLGFDIYTEEGNLGYAQYLYTHQGAKPWVHSAKCHGYY